jgi:hypothetical protein
MMKVLFHYGLDWLTLEPGVLETYVDSAVLHFVPVVCPPRGVCCLCNSVRRQMDEICLSLGELRRANALASAIIQRLLSCYNYASEHQRLPSSWRVWQQVSRTVRELESRGGGRPLSSSCTICKAVSVTIPTPTS